MELSSGARGSWHIVAVRGRVDSLTANNLTATLLAAVAAHDQVAVDCSGVDFISSAGLASLLEGSRSARGAHHQFIVCAPSQRVKQVLGVSGLHNLVEIREELPC